MKELKEIITKIKILRLCKTRHPDDSLKKKHEAICPYCGKRAQDHEELKGIRSTTQEWDVLNQIYLVSCYKKEEYPYGWKVITIGPLKFSLISYPRGFGKSCGFKWKMYYGGRKHENRVGSIPDK